MKKNLYTVDDVAKMTGLTSRTIHNYIRDGKLQGKKVGVQWRFTEENIDELFKDKKVENDVMDSRNTIVLEFLEKKDRHIPEICSVIDYPAQERNLADTLCKKLLDFVNTFQENEAPKFSYQYIEKQRVARFIVIGEIQQVNELIKLVNTKEET
ncbi:helix-turn-helix domain-containing protein [Peribacillus frigoritolerans]|uniref:helix-turn-helix domain-containing protein n=1 Tax=Peribacillus frigoritolerans TaxID=450367 RepID=UPI0034E0C851